MAKFFNRSEISRLGVPKLYESIRDRFSDTPTLAHHLGGRLGLCSLKKAVPDIPWGPCRAELCAPQLISRVWPRERGGR